MHRTVEYPMIVNYQIIDNKIVETWPMSRPM